MNAKRVMFLFLFTWGILLLAYPVIWDWALGRPDAWYYAGIWVLSAIAFAVITGFVILVEKQ